MSRSEPLLSEFLTKEELAAELRRNVRTLDRWAALDMGPLRTRIGRMILYRRTSVQKWLAEQEQTCRRSLSTHQTESARRRNANGKPIDNVSVAQDSLRGPRSFVRPL
jgi:hypothetical protein